MVACCEAGPTGFAFQRQLEAERIDCRVIAPALIPCRPGDRVKTDRRDGRKPAECLLLGRAVNIARIVIRVIAWKRIHSSLWISLLLFLAAPFSPVSDAACGRKRRAW